MPVNFKQARRGAHTYFCAEKGAQFLALTYQIMQAETGLPYVISCRSRTRLTVKQMFAYGRQYVAAAVTFDEDHPDACFRPFSEFVKPFHIGSVNDPADTLTIATPEIAYAMYVDLQAHPLFSAMYVADTWLAADDGVTHSLNIETVSPPLRAAFEAMVRYRRNLDSVSLTDSHLILVRKQLDPYVTG